MGQDQPRVTIWRKLVVLSHLMLHTKFQGNQLSSSWEDVLRFLPLWPYMVEETMETQQPMMGNHYPAICQSQKLNPDRSSDQWET